MNESLWKVKRDHNWKEIIDIEKHRSSRIPFEFEKEYYLSGMFSSVPLKVLENDLKVKELLWLGAQSGGADFKGIARNNYVCLDAKMGSSKAEIKKGFTQSLNGIRQIQSHTLENPKYFGRPKMAVIGVIVPHIEKNLSIHKIFNEIRTENNFSKKKRHNKEIIAMLPRLNDVELRLIEFKRYFFKNEMLIKFNVVSVKAEVMVGNA